MNETGAQQERRQRYLRGGASSVSALGFDGAGSCRGPLHAVRFWCTVRCQAVGLQQWCARIADAVGRGGRGKQQLRQPCRLMDSTLQLRVAELTLAVATCWTRVEPQMEFDKWNGLVVLYVSSSASRDV